MDPNACLREWRELYKQLNSCDGMSQDQINRLGELSEALDEWLSGGGFLPDAWSLGENVVVDSKVKKFLSQL